MIWCALWVTIESPSSNRWPLHSQRTRSSPQSGLAGFADRRSNRPAAALSLICEPDEMLIFCPLAVNFHRDRCLPLLRSPVADHPLATMADRQIFRRMADQAHLLSLGISGHRHGQSGSADTGRPLQFSVSVAGPGGQFPRSGNDTRVLDEPPRHSIRKLKRSRTAVRAPIERHHRQSRSSAKHHRRRPASSG